MVFASAAIIVRLTIVDPIKKARDALGDMLVGVAKTVKCSTVSTSAAATMCHAASTGSELLASRSTPPITTYVATEVARSARVTAAFARSSEMDGRCLLAKSLATGERNVQGKLRKQQGDAAEETGEEESG